MFNSVGFFSWPNTLPRPTGDVVVYRASTAEQSERMSWADCSETAQSFAARHRMHGDVALRRATISPDDVLAYLQRAGEGWTVVVDPKGLTDVTILVDL